MSTETTNASPTSGMPPGAVDYFSSIASSEVNLDTLLKVPVSLSIEVGRTKMSINDLLATREGTVIELDRLMDEPLDILVNGSLIAHGVVVLANDRFGIQITDIVSRHDRVKSI
ncbi:MAG: flagellar motor switch protein FliN [Pseudomonadota bacterium]